MALQMIGWILNNNWPAATHPDVHSDQIPSTCDLGNFALFGARPKAEHQLITERAAKNYIISSKEK